MARGGSGGRGFKITRWAVRLAFLAAFFALAFAAAWPPLETPSANLFLRLDPLAGLISLIGARSVSTFLAFWPAWILLGLTLLSGRFFCGWICPLGTCFDVAGAVKPRKLKYYRPGGKEIKGMLAQEKAGAGRQVLRLKYLLLALVLILGIAGVNLLFFASPLVIANRSVYQLLLPQVPVLLVVLVLLAFVYRPRYWCESLCPMGAMLSLTSMAGKRLKARLSPLSVVKDPEACVECGACYRNCDFGVAEPFVAQNGGRLKSADCTLCGECVAACPADGALAMKSFGGTLYRSKGPAGKRSSRRRAAVTSSELEAGGAGGGFTVNRREFIGSVGVGAFLAAGFAVGLKGVSAPVLRPPGAQDESQFLAACNRCEACARACPVDAIRPMGFEGGLQKLWTPRFEPRRAGCIFDQCDQACAAVCPAGAIAKLAPEDVRIGVARITRGTCKGWQGTGCLVCHESCRFNAIEFKGTRPHVLEDKCTGCGACEQNCPTTPASITVYPADYSSESSKSGETRKGSAGSQ